MKPVVNYHGLLSLLQTYEKDHQLQKGLVNLVEGSRVGHHPFKKRKKKDKEKKVRSAPGLSQAKKMRAHQASAECFYCKKQKHWKRNCPLSHASLDANKPKKGNQQSADQGIYMIKS